MRTSIGKAGVIEEFLHDTLCYLRSLRNRDPHDTSIQVDHYVSGALDGVSAGAVNVDLEHGQVHFVSSRSVPDPQITASLEEPGFRVTGIQQHRLEEPAPSAVSAASPLATVTFDVGTAGSPLVIDLLDRLGSAAFDDDGQFVVVAPSALEATILRPLIAGRKKAIEVAYEVSVEGPVVVTLLAHDYPPQK